MTTEEKMLKYFDGLSRNNRAYTDMLCRLIVCEIKAKKIDETWYDIQLPYYSGKHNGEISVTNKMKINFKSSKEILSKEKISYINDFINELRLNQGLTMDKLREHFSLKLFNYSTTSCISDISLN